MKNTVIILGASYRCGSTFVQRLLNSIPDVLILGEENMVLPSSGKSISSSLRNEEGAKEQKEKVLGGEDCWQANLGMEPESVSRAAGAYYYQWFMDSYKSMGYEKSPSTMGFKSLFATRDTLGGAINIFKNPYIIFLHRNLRDSFASYSKCSWKGYNFREFCGMWQDSMALMTSPYDDILSSRVKYEDIKDFGWLKDMEDKLGLDIDWDKIDKVASSKIRNAKPEQDVELDEKDKIVLENLCP